MTPGASLPRLHVVTDDAVLARPDFLDQARAVLAAGRDRVALHVRGPGTTGRALYDITLALVAAANASGGRVFVNDRVDVALTTGAHGVHLGERSFPLAEARALVGAHRTVGASAHDLGRVEALAAGGVDFIFFGTTFPTPTHPARSGQGVDGVQRAVGAAGGCPVLAIGGVTVERVGALAGVGAHGVAVIRGVWDAAEPAGAVADFLDAIPLRGHEA